jgi:hypothetical protein
MVKKTTSQVSGLPSLYMDESGDFNPKGYCVVIAILATEHPKEIANCIKRIRRRKLGKRRKDFPELKGRKSTEKVLRATLQEITKCNCSIVSITVTGKGAVSPNERYNEVAGILIQECCKHWEKIKLVVDRRDKKARHLFDQHIQEIIDTRRLLFGKPQHEDSTKEPALQAVDCIAYAIRQKYRHDVKEFYEIIREKIIWEGIL